MHRGWNALLLQHLLEAIALRAAQGVLRIHAAAIGLYPDRTEALEQLVVALGERDAPLELPVEAPELGEHHGALQRIHATADADARMHIAPALPVMADLAHRTRQRVIIGEKRAAIAVAAERLRRKKACRADGGQVAAFAP